MARVDYVVVTGHGRSGSNRVLDLFDCHEGTLCRNEPNEVPGGAMSRLPDGFFLGDLDAGFLPAWRHAVAVTGRSFSERDRIGACPKAWAGWAARAVVGRGVLARRRVRRAAGWLVPAWRESEWPASRLYGAGADRALPVLKVLLCQGWIDAVFAAEPGLRVVHNVRDPAAFLRSWYRRYVPRRGERRVFEDNVATIDRILTHFGAAPGRFEAFSTEALVESELWRWRYVNEPLYGRLEGHERYALVRYREASADPVALARRLFAFAGLGLAPRHEARIAGLENTLFGRQPDAPTLDDAVLDAVAERVLADSPLRELF